MFEIDQIITTKKKHVCGNDKWKIIRVGADMKIECINCNRIVLIPRVELEKKIKKESNWLWLKQAIIWKSCLLKLINIFSKFF